MTYTFKLSRRLARFRAIPVLTAILFTMSCAADESSGPASPASTNLIDNSAIEIAAYRTSKHTDGNATTAGTSTTDLKHWKRWNLVTQLSLSPSSATLRPGATQAFSALATWRDGTRIDASIRWIATGGRVDSTGRYTAGQVAGRFLVVGTTLSGATDTSTVTITSSTDSVPSGGSPPVDQVVLSPASATLAIGATQSFIASGKASDGSTVTITPTYTASAGSITSTGKYTAPRTPGKYRVTATDLSSGNADTSTVTVTDLLPVPTRITLTPSTSSITVGATKQFTTSGTATDGSIFTVTPTYSATGGSISAAGLYTAGQTPGTYRVIASATGLADTASITVNPDSTVDPTPPPTLAKVTLSPASASLTTGGTKQFSAAGTGSDGSAMSISPTYTATGGTISASGLYTAGQTAGTFRVIATASGKADTASVVVSAAAPTLAQVVISPASVSLTTGGTHQFSASGKMSDGSSSSVSVTFTVSGGGISSSGVYTAPTTAGTYRVIAKAQSSTLADTAAVTVTAPAAPPPSSGSLLFDDPFTSFGKWSDTEGCDPGTCPWVRTIVSSPVNEGSTAARMEVRRSDPVGSCYNCSKRTEVGRPRLTGWSRDANGPFKAGDEVWFGFSVYIPADWINDAAYTPGGGEILFQLHEQPDGNDWSRNRTSFLRLIAEAGNFRWITYASACALGDACWTAVPTMDGKTDGRMDYIGPMKKGGWTDWVIHAKWSYGSDGLLEIWRDGQQVASIAGANNYKTQQPGFFKMGIYKWNWGNTSIPVRVAGYDNVKICAGNCGLAAVSP